MTSLLIPILLLNFSWHVKTAIVKTQLFANFKNIVRGAQSYFNISNIQ